MSKSIPIEVDVVMTTFTTVTVNYVAGMTAKDIDEVASTLAKQGEGDSISSIDSTSFDIPDELENVL